MTTIRREVGCRACGGLIVANSNAELVAIAQEHSWQIHGHLLPPEHVLSDAVDSSE